MMAAGKRIFEINEDVSASLENAQKGMKATTGAEALRRAIRLTEAMTKIGGDNNEVTVTDANGKKIKLIW